MPQIQITNNNSTSLNLSDVVLEYYIYEPELSVSSLSWRNDWCKVGFNNSAASAYTVSFSRLDTVYTKGDKKADIAASNDPNGLGSNITKLTASQVRTV